MGAVVTSFGLLWLVAALATPVTPWLQPAEGGSLILGLGPIGWSDVVTGTLTAAVVSGAATLVAFAGRAIWIPALLALYLAPPAADRVGGMEYIIPHLAGHWNDWIFGRGEADLDRLLLLTWLGMAIELLVIAIPPILVLRHRRPTIGSLAVGTAVVAGVAALDVVLLEGLVTAPWALVVGLAGLGTVAWGVTGALVLWSLAVAGPFGLLAATGAARVLVTDRGEKPAD